MRVLQSAGHTMPTLKSVKVFLQAGDIEGLALTEAVASIRLNDQSDTVFKIKQPDGTLLDVEVLRIPGHVYRRAAVDGYPGITDSTRFFELTTAQAAEELDLSQLFTPGSGLFSLLGAGRYARYQRSEELGDAKDDMVTATYAPNQIGGLLRPGVAPAGDVQATVWSGQSDHLVRRMLLSGPLLQAGQKIAVDLDLSNLNQPVFIRNPPF